MRKVGTAFVDFVRLGFAAFAIGAFAIALYLLVRGELTAEAAGATAFFIVIAVIGAAIATLVRRMLQAHSRDE